MFASFRLPCHHMLGSLVTCCLCVTGALQLDERRCRICCYFTLLALVRNTSPFLICLTSFSDLPHLLQYQGQWRMQSRFIVLDAHVALSCSLIDLTVCMHVLTMLFAPTSIWLFDKLSFRYVGSLVSHSWLLLFLWCCVGMERNQIATASRLRINGLPHWSAVSVAVPRWPLPPRWSG